MPCVPPEDVGRSDLGSPTAAGDELTAAPYMETATGRSVYFLAPQQRQFCVEDIAHSLSHLCRFTGHTRVFYSVAEHSLNTVRFMAFNGSTPLSLLLGLLHDAAEAYIQDLSTPLKQALCSAAYSEIETHIQQALLTQLIGPHGFDAWMKRKTSISAADRKALKMEAGVLMVSGGRGWGALEGVETPERSLKQWSMAEARNLYIKTYNELKIAYELGRPANIDFLLS